MTRREPHMRLAYPLSLPPALSSAGYLKTIAAVWHLVIGLVLLSSVVWYEGQRRLGQLPFNADWVERQTLYYVYVGIWLATFLGMIVQLLEEHQALYASSNFFAEDVHERFSSRWLNLGTFCVSTADGERVKLRSAVVKFAAEERHEAAAARGPGGADEAGGRFKAAKLITGKPRDSALGIIPLLGLSDREVRGGPVEVAPHSFVGAPPSSCGSGPPQFRRGSPIVVCVSSGPKP